MQSEATTRMVREVKQPLHTAVACLAPHSSKILSSWRALLRTHKSCIRFVPPLLGLHVAPQRVELFLSDPENYRKESEREGWELANRAVPQECAGIAVGLYVETCLPYLLTGEPKQTEWTQAFARWASVYQFFLLTGYARHEAAARQSLEERVSQAERRSQEFSVQLGDAYEIERRRLAQDLHDEIGHDLIVLKLYTQLLNLDLKKGQISQLRRKLKESLSLINHALKGVRHLTFHLGPAVWSEQGFLPAVRLYSRQFSRRTGLRVRFDARRLKTNLPPRYETPLYKVIQGALSNAAAHSAAR